MDKVFEKLSTYHIVTALIPGAILCALINRFTDLVIITGNGISDIVIFYFAGVISGRFGSIILEPLCKKIKLVKYAPYSDFIKACEKDSKLIELSNENNMFRSLLSVSVMFSFVMLYEFAEGFWTWLLIIRKPLLCVGLIVLFSISYRKQTKYVYERTKYHIGSTIADDTGSQPPVAE